MEDDASYKAHHKDVIAMRKDVSDLQNNITKKDPTMIEKANSKLDKIWKDMKNWSKSDKQ